MAFTLKEGVYWVGAIDWNIREFHGYETKDGSSYNSYLIKDEKIVLIDTVKKYLFDEFYGRIKKVVDPEKIDYIVVNHVEMDHSSSLEKIMEISKAKIITNQKAKEHLELHYNTKDWEYIIVDSGDSVNIGKRNLTFVKTPMLHWPDNMVTYCPEDKILFSNDAFGQHIASSERFDFEIDYALDSAKEYFANILLPYRTLIPNAVKTVDTLETDLICPSHGIIWKENISKIKEKYLEFASNNVINKAVIVYDTMYSSTEKIGLAIAEGLIESGVEVKVFKISKTPVSKIIAEILDAKYVLVGSPTLNINLYPEVARFLKYMEGLKPNKKIAAAFGSYGWAESATKHIKNTFDILSFDTVDDECLTCRFVPNEKHLKKCQEFGKKLAEM
ncbi:FprA family A-type flavoprotein [Methanococcus maripaludis]|uniref:Flavorubredoxin n=1 Tax=Methanococcus maripaludis TaxID=39152 RepID=A0A2L1CCI4_METMI|nr:FprA family A-type flavoprotein [Methanococcus maripaludis]AVB77054.1 Nitric oxide reductase [Methanococcus maripaludis]MBA2863566.1 flavorubredoxin [Methanococcus maripaludis]MBB6496429.1 flavorubredoxin [Methanococcus maripaludis]